MKKKVSYATCSIFVLGLDMTCPFCGKLVKSGETHGCTSEDRPKKTKAKPKRRKVAQ